MQIEHRTKQTPNAIVVTDFPFIIGLLRCVTPKCVSLSPSLYWLGILMVPVIRALASSIVFPSLRAFAHLRQSILHASIDKFITFRLCSSSIRHTVLMQVPLVNSSQCFWNSSLVVPLGAESKQMEVFLSVMNKVKGDPHPLGNMTAQSLGTLHFSFIMLATPFMTRLSQPSWSVIWSTHKRQIDQQSISCCQVQENKYKWAVHSRWQSHSESPSKKPGDGLPLAAFKRSRRYPRLVSCFRPKPKSIAYVLLITESPV
jgi:hypothetical protein